LKVKVFDLKLH